MSRNAEDFENSGLLPQLESEPAVEQIGNAPEEVPFEIPKKWKWVFLRDISKRIHYGYTTAAKEAGNSHLLRITDIKFDGVDWKSVPFCEIDEKTAKKFLLRDGDIVIARTGGTIGKSFVVENVCGSSIFASYLIRVQPIEDYVSSKYLVNFLSSSEYWKQLSDASRGTGQPNVNAVALGSLRIPLPPLAEQRRIVAQLNKLLPLVDEFGAAQEVFEVAQTEFPSRLKTSLLQAAIEGKLVPQLESEPEVKQIGEAPVDVPFEIPKKWKWVHVTAVQTLIRGITFPASAKNKEPKAGLIQCLTTGSVQQTYRSASDVYVKSEFVKNNKQYLKQGDVVLSSANSRELVGKNILWECNADNKTSFGGFLTVARSRSDALTSEFAYIIYQYLFISGKFMEIATQTTNIANISNKVLSEVVLPIPPLAEQRRIVARLNELLPLLDDLH